MMIKKQLLSLILANVMLAVLVSGCMTKSQPTSFFTLTATVNDQGSTEKPTAAHDLIVGVGPLSLADYLAQSRIVTRIDDNMVGQAEFNQWSGSFKNNIINVLADNISSLLGTDKVFVHPWRAFIPIDYQIVLEISRFDGTPEEQVTLEARWTVLKGKDKSIIDIKRSEIQETIDAPGYAGLVAAQSRALAILSTEIAQSIHDGAVK